MAHGSRGREGTVEVPAVLRRVVQGVRPLLSPGVEVTGAALQFNHPSLEEAVESLATNGVRRVVIVPYFLFRGRHITEHIPQLMEKLEHTHPEMEFAVANTLGLDELLVVQVAKRIEECAPELSPSGRNSGKCPDDIEQRSMEIVEGLLPDLPRISEEERAVVRRIVHASGDPQIAHLMRFSTSAVARGISAIRAGGPMVTDVQMVAAGINKTLLETFGCPLTCALDETERSRAEGRQTTRAAAAMRLLGTKLNNALVAIGNAPTALLALIELIDGGEVEPALVVGMPVGFVQARESKEELMKRAVPYITITGTRGGSATAAATVNALLKIAADRDPDAIHP